MLWVSKVDRCTSQSALMATSGVWGFTRSAQHKMRISESFMLTHLGNLARLETNNTYFRLLYEMDRMQSCRDITYLRGGVSFWCSFKESGMIQQRPAPRGCCGCILQSVDPPRGKARVTGSMRNYHGDQLCLV